MQNKVMDHQEIEWQFEAHDLGTVEDWLEKHPSSSGLSVALGGTKEITNTYYHT